MESNDLARIQALPCWQGRIEVEPLSGGMTNINYRVRDETSDFVVRFGEDDPVHLISRANEVACCQAAYAAGLSPALIHHGDGILVVQFIEGQVFSEPDIAKPENLPRIISLLKQFHHEMPKRFNQIPVMFWVFQVLRHYQNLLTEGNSSHKQRLVELGRIANQLEKDVGAVEIVFGHNDLLAANFIDDGEKIWLIDFDYAGFNSPLFDLANLASNNELSETDETGMLELYFGNRFDRGNLRAYHAMKCASLLRETLWSMVSELYSKVDMDFADYTTKNLERFESVYAAFNQHYQ
ncbi:MAG: choline/ethanolamine kinase family protein [Pseudomonadota bacterium]